MLTEEACHDGACNKNNEYRILELSDKHFGTAEGRLGQLVVSVDFQAFFSFLTR